MRDFLLQRGFSDQDLAGLVDHRWLLLAWDAFQGSTSKARVTKKIGDLRKLKLPRVVPPGARREGESGKARQQQAMERLRRTGSDRDAARVLEGLI
jgi:hypothetical protein